MTAVNDESGAFEYTLYSLKAPPYIRLYVPGALPLRVNSTHQLCSVHLKLVNDQPTVSRKYLSFFFIKYGEKSKQISMKIVREISPGDISPEIIARGYPYTTGRYSPEIAPGDTPYREIFPQSLPHRGYPLHGDIPPEITPRGYPLQGDILSKIAPIGDTPYREIFRQRLPQGDTTYSEIFPKISPEGIPPTMRYSPEITP